MKCIVIYKSAYGNTKKYADSIAKQLSCDLFEKKSVKSNDLNKYDTIIYGGGLYAGGLAGIDFITKNYNEIADKNIIVFTCGIANPYDAENAEHIRKSLYKTLTPSMQKKIKIFHLRGGINYKKLNVIHKAMMAMLNHVLKKKDDSSLSLEDKEMLATYGSMVDFVDLKTIEPIVDYAKQTMKH